MPKPIAARPSIPVIFGCKGFALSVREKIFFRETNPAGLILFSRNCKSPDQVKDLVADFKNLITSNEPLILIDQEGGRVQRLVPPFWAKYPSASSVAAIADRDFKLGREAAHLFGRLLASDLEPLGITVNCTPVLDVLCPKTHDIISDRALGSDVSRIKMLGRALCDGLLAGGVLPVIKHMPGHGRALVDSHQELPVVDATAQELESSDFLPFRSLRDMPLAMTAHVVFEAIDPKYPATTSRLVIKEAIRGTIGYKGIIISDDISMNALSGNVGDRARDAMQAGCDLILHCNGILGEMELVANTVCKTPKDLHLRIAGAGNLRKTRLLQDNFDPNHGLVRLTSKITDS